MVIGNAIGPQVDAKDAQVQENRELADPKGPGTHLPDEILFAPGELFAGLPTPVKVGRVLLPHAGFGQSRYDTFPRPYDD